MTPSGGEGADLSRGAAEDVRTVARGGAVQIVGQLSQRGLSFLFTAAFFRLLSPAAYGLYRQVAQILAIAAQLGLAGFNYAAMRFITRARATGDTAAVRGSARVALVGASAASIAVTAGLIAAATVIAGGFADSEDDVSRLADLLRIGAAYIPLFALMQVLRYCTQAYKTMVPSVVVGNVVQPTARFLLGTGALVAGFEVAGAVTSLVASVGIGTIAAAFYFRRMLTAEERAVPPKGDPGAMMRFALPQGGASLLGVQTLGIGILLLGALGSDAAVGLFGLALTLQGPGTVFLGGVVNIWAPVVADLYERGEIDRLGSLYKTINRWIATFSFPVFAALMIVPDLFVEIVGGEGAKGAAPVVAILAAGNLFYSGTGPTGYVLSMTGRPGVNFANSAVAVALYIALGFAIVPEHGLIGMAIVDALVTALVNVARVVEAKLLVGIQPFGRTFMKPVVATALAAVVLVLWVLATPDEWVLQIAGLVGAAVVYLLILRRLGLDPEERHVFERIRKRLPKGGGR